MSCPCTVTALADRAQVDWMTDRVLQLVIAELQPKSVPSHPADTSPAHLLTGRMPLLLLTAQAANKHKVHVERGGMFFAAFPRFLS